MGVAEKYNKGNVFTFKETDGFVYKSLEDLYNSHGEETIFSLRAVFINTKSKYGDSPVAVTSDCFVNLPTHLLETVKEMLVDDEFINAVNDGKVGFTVYEYQSNHRQKPCYSVRFIDL